MYQFSNKQQSKALFWLILFHIAVIASSNYLVQFPFTIVLPNGFEVHSTWGALTFPFIFFFVMLPALILSYALSVLFQNGVWTSLAALGELNLLVFRISLASFAAYVFGQIMDIFVFNKLRQLKSWWIAPTASTFVGNAIDTLLFFAIAFYGSSDAFMAANWQHIAFVDYLFKLLICTALFVPAYGVLLNILTRRLMTAQIQTA